jgi:hypothetical protein
MNRNSDPLLGLAVALLVCAIGWGLVVWAALLS